MNTGGGGVGRGPARKVFDAPDKEAEKEKDRELLAVSRHVATLRMLEEGHGVARMRRWRWGFSAVRVAR